MAKTKEVKKINRTTELLILAVSLILVIFFWDTYLVYPIKLFVVLLHELSHAFITMITAGTVKEADIGFDLSGRINASGGNEIAISSAGYIGSLIIGLFLFISADKTKLGSYFFYLLAGIVLLTITNSNPTLAFMLLSIGVFSSLILFGIFLKNIIVALFVKAVALASIMYVLIDIKEDILIDNLSSDAMILSNLSGINSTLIGIAWLAVSMLALFIMLRVVYFGKNK